MLEPLVPGHAGKRTSCGALTHPTLHLHSTPSLPTNLTSCCHLFHPPCPLSQINEEAELHNRLLDDLDEQVDGTRSRLAAAQRRLKLVMRRSGSCKTMTLMFLVAVILVVVLVIGFKVALHLALLL